MRGQFLLRVGAAALFLTLAIALANSAVAAGLKCVCTNCTYQSGRTEVPYTFDPNFNSTAAGRAQYDAAEKAAMNQADQAAVDAIAAAMASAPICPDPCNPQPAWDSSHGPPFAGGTGGSGLARSLWKVTYSCFKKVVVPPPAPPPAAPPPSNGGVNVVPGGQPIPPKPPGATTCPNCQAWVDLIQRVDRTIADAWALFNKYPGMMDGRWAQLMQELQAQRAADVENLHNCEKRCMQPSQNMTAPPPPSTEPQPQNPLPFGFGFGGFGTGGGDFNGDDSKGDNFKKGQDVKKKP